MNRNEEKDTPTFEHLVVDEALQQLVPDAVISFELIPITSVPCPKGLRLYFVKITEVVASKYNLSKCGIASFYWQNRAAASLSVKLEFPEKADSENAATDNGKS